METIQGGTIDFDRCIATPDMMAIVGRLGKVLGPRNLMPNPKVGTVTMDVEKAVKLAKSGEVQFKVEKSGVVQAGLGKVSFDKQKISENITAFIESVNKAKPTGAKGSYLKRISVSSTMGPSVTLDSGQFVNSALNLSKDDDLLRNFLIECLSDIPFIEKQTSFQFDAWININRKGDYNKRHHHFAMYSSLFLSGVYYVSVPEDSGRIRFYDPRGPLVCDMIDQGY